MSIDQRLRSGLRTDVQETRDLTALLDGWADVQARAEQQRVRDRGRWVVGIAAAAVLVVVAAVTWWPRGEDVQPIEPVPSPTAPTSATTSPPSLIEGTWTTGPVPAQGIVDHLESVGLGQWAEEVLQGTAVGDRAGGPGRNLPRPPCRATGAHPRPEGAAACRRRRVRVPGPQGEPLAHLRAELAELEVEVERGGPIVSETEADPRAVDEIEERALPDRERRNAP